jgi:hypothetical protein
MVGLHYVLVEMLLQLIVLLLLGMQHVLQFDDFTLLQR